MASDCEASSIVSDNESAIKFDEAVLEIKDDKQIMIESKTDKEFADRLYARLCVTGIKMNPLNQQKYLLLKEDNHSMRMATFSTGRRASIQEFDHVGEQKPLNIQRIVTSIPKNITDPTEKARYISQACIYEAVFERNNQM